MRKTVLPLASVAIAVLLACGLALGSSQVAAPQEAKKRPNVVVAMSDDQNEEEAMSIPRIVNYGRGGATFSESFVTNSLCCPPRATLLRGQYSNNHGAITNSVLTGGYPKFVRLGRARDNLVTRLDATGYHTAHFGKYLNGYSPSKHGTPPGWDRFAYVTENKRAWDRGKWRTFSAFHDDYSTNLAAAFIKNRKGSNTPFYVQLDLHSPHAPYDAPERNKGVHANDPIETKPSLSEDLSDKPQWVRDTRAWIRPPTNPRGSRPLTPTGASALTRARPHQGSAR